MDKSAKQQQQFRRALLSVLKDFERNREWADIGNWLYKFEEVLKNQAFTYLPEKLIVGKRLAQCLNPNLPPGVHGTALRIYQHIFTNCPDRVELFPAFSVGLFNFFEYSTSQLKFQVLKIIDKFYIDTVEVIPMLVGLVNAIIPGLNENHQELSKKIYAIFEKINGMLGRRWVDGAVWVNILKSPRARLACFKYFQKVFKDRDRQGLSKKESLDMARPEVKENPKINTEQNLDSIRRDMIRALLSQKEVDDPTTRFPNLPCLVLNALLVCLTEGEVLVQRSALDLMISNLGLNESFMGPVESQILVQACLHLLLKKQPQLTRRIYPYFFGAADNQGHYNIGAQSQKVLGILERSFNRILHQDIKQSIECPVQILQIMLKDHEILTTVWLPRISENMMSYVAEFYRKEPKLDKAMQSFLQVIQPKLNLFIDSLVVKLDQGNDEKALDIVKLLDFYYSILCKGHDSLADRETIQNVFSRILRRINLDKKDIEQLTFPSVGLQFLLRMGEEYKVNAQQADVEILESLLQCSPPENIYACLLHLHPAPKHSFLLPYIEGGPLSLTTLTLLINSETPVAAQHLDRVFTCVFRLLDCHLWQDQAIDLIKKFNNSYPQTFYRDIEHCDINQWLIYWRKLNGDVRGAGVIRMLKFMNHQNPLKRHCSLTWLQQSSHIISKILQPVFKVLSSPNQDQDYIAMYEILMTIFNNEQKEFCVFLFSQRETYLNILLARLFEDLGLDIYQLEVKTQKVATPKNKTMPQFPKEPEEKSSVVTTVTVATDVAESKLPQDILERKQSKSAKLRSETIRFIGFLLNTVLPEQKVEWIQLTFINVLKCLQNSIESGDYEMQVQLLSYISQITRTMTGLIKWKPIMAEFLECPLLLKVVLHGLNQTKISYVKSQYIKFLTEMGEVLSVMLPKKSISIIVNSILEKYSMMLKEIDIGKLQQLIQGKKVVENKRRPEETKPRKHSQDLTSKGSFTGVDGLQLIQASNIETKYSDTTTLWNGLKYYVSFSIAQQLDEFRVDNLLSLILNSFPFSFLNYRQYHPESVKEISREIQEEVKSVSGLKKQVLEIFDAIWRRYSKSILSLIIEKSDPRILIHANLDPVLVMHSLLETSQLKSVLHYYKITKLSLPKNYLHYNRDILHNENRMMYFAYLYIEYADLHAVSKYKYKLWESVFTFIKHMQETTNVQTKVWLIELLDLFFKKISLKEIGLDHKNRNELQEIVRDLVNDLTSIITKSKDFTHKSDIKAGLRGLFSKEEKDERSFDFLRIFPPTVYEMENNYQVHKADVNYYIQDMLFSNCNNMSEPQFKQCLAIVCCRTLSSVIVNVVGTAYDNDTAKMVPMIKQCLNAMITVCENKSEGNQIFIELVSEILHKIVMSPSKTDIMKVMKRPIFEVYMGNDFFKCTKKTLSFWKDIINTAAEMDDILSDLLAKETGLSGLFTGKAESTRLKIKSFQRICFIIYAGKVDQYEHKLRSLLQSLNDVMRQGETSHPALLILILFCIRILIIRLSQTVLNKMFKTIWSSLMTLLMQIFQKKKSAKNPNLLLAGLKVIEIIMAMQLEQFNLLKWIFIFDYFGIQIEALSPQEQQKYPQTFVYPFNLEPLLMNVLPKSSYMCSYIPASKDQVASYEPPHRKLIIKEPSVESDNELRNHAYILVQYMLSQNQRRTKQNKDDIEGVIEADFISLDDYIFGVK